MNCITLSCFLLIASAILPNFSEITASDCIDTISYGFTRGMTGGVTKTSPFSPKIKQAAKKLQNEINEQSPRNCQVKLKKVLKASTQVVAGVIIRLSMELCPLGTGCKTTHCEVCSAKIFENLKGAFNVECFECGG